MDYALSDAVEADTFELNVVNGRETALQSGIRRRVRLWRSNFKYVCFFSAALYLEANHKLVRGYIQRPALTCNN